MCDRSAAQRGRLGDGPRDVSIWFDEASIDKKNPTTVAISLFGWSSVPEGMMQVLSSAVGPRATCTNVRSL